ncbi:hypothetical protein KX721_14635 [Klebsiella quasipneumoniae]|uniref:hypothetical protein n=1 Tax=Klebsiella quasipneumoniae TaxID=1463165 RepID=UPI001CA3BBE3|nr:hypothetical protein [Klebsiella quasipneumoniae]MBY8385139.1 hypothetical protein [Klebsiella quasipneumoniae]
MDIEAYKVAVKLNLSENITAGLLGISRHFARTEQSAASLRNELGRIGKMTAVGGGLLAVGITLSKGLDAALKSAKEVAKAQADFKTLNLNAMEIAQVNAMAAEQTHKSLGSTIAGNIRLIQDLHTAFGDLHHALEVAPQFTKYETVVKMALGERAADGTVNAMARALEHRGGKVVNNPVEFQKELAMATQVQLATKNRVSPKDYLQASQTGKMAYALLSPEYLYGPFAGMMSMNGGFQSGTALMTAFSSLIGGHMDKKAKGFLADIGMYDEGVSKARMKIMRDAMKGMSAEEKKVYMQSLGGESLLSGGLKPQYAALFSSPDKLAAVMAEHVRKRFGANLSDEQVAEIIAKNFNRNTGGFIGQHILNRNKFAKDAAIFRKSQDFESGYDTYLNSPDGASAALTAAWTNLKATLGLQLLPTVTKLTLAFAKFLDKTSEFAEKNPQLTKIAAYAVAVTAGLTSVAGGVLLLGAAISAARLVSSLGVVTSIVSVLGGPLTLAAAAAAGATYLVYKNWDQIKPAAKKMGEEFKFIMSDIWSRMKEAGSRMKDAPLWRNLSEAFNSFSNKLSSGFSSLYDYIVSIINKLPGVNILNSGELGLKSRADQLLMDVNQATGAKRGGLASDTPYSKGYAAAMSGGANGGMSYADGMRQASSGLAAPAVVSRSDQMIQVHSNLHMDGKKIAEGVTTHQAKQASRAPSGVSGVDTTMNLIHAGMGSFVTR